MMNCPRCGAECWRDEVDVGVGVIYGPWRCGECVWGEEVVPWSEPSQDTGVIDL